jgi:chromosome segregation ATPase
VNYIAPGLRELGRIFDRQIWRLRLVWERRKLAQLESRLGLLGWQQADYGPGVRQHVERLNDVERTQAQLTNESAALGLTLQQLEERRASEGATFESQRAARHAVREPLVGPFEEAGRALTAKERERKELEERISTLTREKVSDEEKYRALLAKGVHTPGEEAEVQRLQRRVIAIPREQQEWQEKLASVQAEIPRLETELEQRRALLSVETEALRALERSFAESDDQLADEIATHKRGKQKLEKRINDLERTKTQPYREIGKALADQHIEPMNQPQALAAVLAQRETVAAQEARVAASLESSRREKRIEVWASWTLLFTFAVLIWGAIWFGLKGR